MMTLRYLYELNPDDGRAEVIIESETLEPIVSCVEHFWDNLGVQIPYFRLLDYSEKGIIIDFGHHYRFYHLVGYEGDFYKLASDWENARRLK